MKYFIGIDPGITGGMCIIDEAGRLLSLVTCPKTLAYQWDALTTMRMYQEKYNTAVQCVIEAVHSMPKQGVKSVWTFSGNYHAWLMALVAAEIPYRQVTPHTWQKTMGAMPKDKKLRKHRLLHLAQQQFPAIKITLALADAVLIAAYTRDSFKRS